jgi:predicted amidophosphoribosyltransferase
MLDVLLPQRCILCHVGGAQVCGECIGRLQRLRPPLCARCGAPTAWPVERCRECAGRRLAFASARAALAYDASARTIVSAWKERGLRRLAKLAARLVVDSLPRPDVAAIVFVPPDGDRALARGHHPPERLARGLGESWDLPVLPVLARTRRIDRQRGLARDERRRNVARAFTASRSLPSRVALVDDVYTSGATAAAAASALRSAGARHVAVITLARAIRHG